MQPEEFKNSKYKKDMIYGGIIVLLFLFLGVREWMAQRHENNVVAELATYKSDASHYKILGEEIASNKAIALATQDQMRSVLASNDTMKKWINKFKDIKAGGIIKETTIIKEVAVPFESKIPCDFKPFPAKKLTKEFSLYSTIANTGLTIDSLFIPNTATIIVGDKKSGFLGMKHTLTMEVKNSNPLMHVSDISAYTYKPEKKFYEKFWFPLAIGFGTGFIGQAYLQNKLGK